MTEGISATRRISHWIDGRGTPGSSGRTAPVYNPATGQQSAEVDLASGGEIDHAVAKAVAASKDWRHASLSARSGVLFAFRDLLHARTDELAAIITSEHGKVLSDAAGEIARGLDVFELTPTKFLTQNEIDAAKAIQVSELNVQNQQKIEWPAKLVVAKAYVDQLSRSQALPPDKIADLQKAIHSAESSHMSKDALAKLKSMAPSLTTDAGSAKNQADAARLRALAAILEHPSA